MYAILLALLMGCNSNSINSESDAIKKAEDELVKLYGDKVLAHRPFSARLDQVGWIVTGSTVCPPAKACRNHPLVIFDMSTGEVSKISDGETTTIIKRER